MWTGESIAAWVPPATAAVLAMATAAALAMSNHQEIQLSCSSPFSFLLLLISSASHQSLYLCGVAVYLSAVAVMRRRRSVWMATLCEAFSSSSPPPPPSPPPGDGEDKEETASASAMSPDPHSPAFVLALVEFPRLWELGTSFGFLKTFGVPAISRVLTRSRGFERAPQRRYDDTLILMHEAAEHGPRSERGAEALKRIRRIHARHSGITREGLLYTLWVFSFEPMEWVERCGWRKLSAKERHAVGCFWLEVGAGLGIEQLPSDPSAFEAWGRQFERQHGIAPNSNAVVVADEATETPSLSSSAPLPTGSTPTMGVQALSDEEDIRAQRALASSVFAVAADWLPQMLPQRMRQTLVTWVVCTLCAQEKQHGLLHCLGLDGELQNVPIGFASVLNGAIWLRAVLVAVFMPPRPVSLAATITRPLLCTTTTGSHGRGEQRRTLAFGHGCPSFANGVYTLDSLG